MNSASLRLLLALRTIACGLVAAGFLIACGRSKPSIDAGGTAPTSLEEGQSSPFSPRTPELQSDLLSLDPLEDGWGTEHLNSVASEQLKKLGELFEAGQLADRDKLAPIFAARVECERLRPADLATAYVSGGTLVHRPAVGLAPQPADFKSWAEGLSPLTLATPEGAERHAHFKIIRVEPREGGFDTSVLVSLDAQRVDTAWEQNAKWKIGWDLGAGDAKPKICAIALEEFEEVVSSQGGTWFNDCTAAVFKSEPKIAMEQLGVGVDHWVERLNDYLLVGQFGHNGMALGDVNGDGFEDLYRCQVGGLPNRLFLGQPDGTVRDHSAAAGVDFLDNTRGALLIDVDADGDQDLVLAMPLEIVVLENDGTGSFEIRTRFNQQHVYSLAAADFDLDGDLDLYACVYYAKGGATAELPIPMPTYNAKNGGRNVLLRNDGAWAFSDVTDSVGLGEDNSRFSFSAIWEDYDNDGKIDLYVANDYGQNNLYRNVGGRFLHVTEESGTANGTFGMSATAGDFNRDGWMDLYKASMYSSAGNRVVTQAQFLPSADAALKDTMLELAQGNTLFTNDGKGAFRDDSLACGVAMGRWSWGSIFIDFNNDGWEDLFVTNGFVTGRQADDL